MSAMGITDKQARLLNFIKWRMESGDCLAPSLDEMATFMGLKSKSGIYRMLVALEERGRIVRLPHRARAIDVVDVMPLATGGFCPHCSGAIGVAA